MGINSSISSGPLTTDTKLVSGADYLKGVLLFATSHVRIYDGEDTSSDLIFEYDNSTGTLPAFCDFSHMVQSKKGMYVEVVLGTIFVYHR